MLFLVACDEGLSSSLPDAPVADDAVDASGPRALGLNDVSLLLPLPVTSTDARLTTMMGRIPTDLYEWFVLGPGDVTRPASDFHVVAVRFDLCDRQSLAPCPSGAEGSLRLVAQTMTESATGFVADDVALHTFYPVPAAEIDSLVIELRSLGELAATPQSPLRPSTAFDNSSYAARWRGIVTRYAVSSRLQRLTVFARDARAPGFVWAFRGVARTASGFEETTVPTTAQRSQHVTLRDTYPTYDTDPSADHPAGFALAIEGHLFSHAESSARLQAIESLVAVDNPRTTTVSAVQCASCHLSTLLTAKRAMQAGVDVEAVSGRYESVMDLTPSEYSRANDFSLRAFGWHGMEAAISQRVVNETAVVIEEIAQRFR